MLMGSVQPTTAYQHLLFSGKQVKLLVELDQFKATLNSYTQPVVEVRDSL